MFKTISLFIFIILLVWITQDYFSIDLPTVDRPKKSMTKHLEHNQVKVEKYKANVIKNILKTYKKLTLLELLEANAFYDALTFYLDESTDIHKKQMENYLASLAKSNPSLALEYMQVFLDNVPESMVWKLMIETHITQGNLAKAIELIIKAKEDYVSEVKDKRLSKQLKNVAITHIDALIQRKEYAQLITFLEEMINYDGTDNFYAFRLAQLYMELDKVSEASVLLEELQYDEVYAQNVKTLLNTIDKDEEESYEYAIPLQKYGDHYVANVLLDGTAFNLLLDTGATYIFIDEDKASMLAVVRDDLVLQTASTNINAKLCMASDMRVGNLELHNIQITTAPFKREGVDGLLGMNFFKQFTFFINQDENVLYLNPKK